MTLAINCYGFDPTSTLGMKIMKNLVKIGNHFTFRIKLYAIEYKNDV